MKQFFTFLMATCLMTLPAYAQEPKEDSSRVGISTGRYITGGVLASTIGLGIGHAVQGRYGERGWIFTATEVTSLVLITSALSRCVNRSLSGSSWTYDNCSSESGTIALGYAAFLGFHIWEIIDAWTGARPVSDDKKASFMIVPDPRAPSAFVAWRF